MGISKYKQAAPARRGGVCGSGVAGTGTGTDTGAVAGSDPDTTSGSVVKGRLEQSHLEKPQLHVQVIWQWGLE